MNPKKEVTDESPQSIFLLDECCNLSREIRRLIPPHMIEDIHRINEFRAATDSEIKEYLIRTNKILITSDHRFALKLLLDGKKVVFVENAFDKDEIHILYPSVKAGRGLFWSSLDMKCLIEG